MSDGLPRTGDIVRLVGGGEGWEGKLALVVGDVSTAFGVVDILVSGEIVKGCCVSLLESASEGRPRAGDPRGGGGLGAPGSPGGSPEAGEQVEDIPCLGP